MSKKKLTDAEKDDMQKAFKDAALTEADIMRMAVGEDDSGVSVAPVETHADLVTAAASALEFVEGLATPSTRADAIVGDGAVAGFDALLKKLETLRGDIAALQRGVVGVFAAQLLAFRGKVVELKSRISEEMVDKLRMQFFKTFIEATFVDIVDQEFSALEKDLVDKIVEQTQARFKEFASKVRESEMDLRSTIVEQQDIVRSFMESLEDDSASTSADLTATTQEITKLEAKIRELQIQVDESKTDTVAADELNRRISDLETEISALREDLFKKDARVKTRTTERDEAVSEVEELKMKLAESETELEVYKQEAAISDTTTKVDEAEVNALQSKVDLLEKSVTEKREKVSTQAAKISEIEAQLKDVQKEKEVAEAGATKHVEELEAVQEKLGEVTSLESKVYELEQEAKDAEKKESVLQMQKEAFEKATRLMEKERDLALEARDIATERTERYITVLGLEADTKVLLLVDEVGSMTFKALGKSLGIPTGLATKHARELAKLGVIKIKGEKAYSTLKEIDIEEGEVKVD
ncbi:MAG: hypothetical protein ACTSU3_07570 [Candidatus Thorarchaeota archaeon]